MVVGTPHSVRIANRVKVSTDVKVRVVYFERTESLDVYLCKVEFVYCSRKPILHRESNSRGCSFRIIVNGVIIARYSAINKTIILKNKSKQKGIQVRKDIDF